VLDFSQLEFFANLKLAKPNPSLDRRALLKSCLPATLLTLGLFHRPELKQQELELPDDPLAIVRAKRLPTLTAMVNAQVEVLWRGSNHCRDNVGAIVEDILVYMSYLPKRIQQGSNMALLWLDAYAVKHTGRRLHRLPASRIGQLLNQGEIPRRSKLAPPNILWENDHLLHLAASGIFMLGRMVIFSRQPARQLIGFSWSKPCENPDNLVTVAQPPLADLNQKFDVCILGSGAGGATVAQRLSAAGRRVLIIDAGDFVSPDALIKKIPQPDGRLKLSPPRSDEVLYRLYKDAGAQISGGLSNVNSKLDLALPNRRKKIEPKQSVNVVQARVFGGGPYVNNAIHLPISEAVYNEKWTNRRPAGLPYDLFAQIMETVRGELGVNTEVTKTRISDRSLRFREGAENLGQTVHPLPVAINESSEGCGSDNSVDSFGDHVGGMHPYSENGPNSFLVQSLNGHTPAAVSYRTTANRIRIHRTPSGGLKVAGVDVERIDDCGETTMATVCADEFVVATGVGQTTKLVGQGLHLSGLSNRHVGHRLTANVGSVVYAMYDKPIWPSKSGNPEPGVTQCYLVDERWVERDGKVVKEPALENWFHFPGTVAVALCGWFEEFACAMKKFNHLSMAGIVVPTKVRPSNYADLNGKIHLQIDDKEFDLLLQGMRRTAEIFLAAQRPDDSVSLYLPTKSVLLRGGRPLRVRSMDDFKWAMNEIRKRGPAFVNLLSTHPQGGVSLGDVVDPHTFQVKTDCDERVENLTVADATLFPAGCEINPQLTVKALATLAAHQITDRTSHQNTFAEGFASPESP
jgi:hypothetical protein